MYVSPQWMEECVQFLMAKNICCNRYNSARQMNDPLEDLLFERVWEMYLDWDLREICDQQLLIPADLNVCATALLLLLPNFESNLLLLIIDNASNSIVHSTELYTSG